MLPLISHDDIIYNPSKPILLLVLLGWGGGNRNITGYFGFFFFKRRLAELLCLTPFLFK